mgnify:CR=1 FL=1
MIKKIVASTIFMIATLSTGLLYISQPVGAIDAANFDSGRIIDDALFYDKGGMGGVSEVQSFLNAHTPSCDTWGTRPSGYGSLTNAQYAQQIKGWHGPPYVCLNNYHENTNTGETSFEKGGGYFPGGKSSAQIIYDAAQQYGINPKVLLVLLRKESLNLFSDSWPLKSQYKYAMGYACPDSGPNYSAACVGSKSGFYKQVTLAAWQLRYYYDHMGEYNYAPGRWNTIQYSPNPACGTKDVYIQNYATASLYIYTPYTPNNASLNAYPGTAPCGSYGNRNFWYFWQEWFGGTYAKFVKLDEPRWMATKIDTRKVDIITGKETGEVIRAGTQVLLRTKIFLPNGVFVRTDADTASGAYLAIPLTNFKEIDYEAMEAPRWMYIKSGLQKQVPSSGVSEQQVLGAGYQLFFKSKIVINGRTFLRTEFDTEHGFNKGIPLESLADPTYETLDEPRWMQTRSIVNQVTPQTGEISGVSNISPGTQLMFTTKVYVNNEWYLRTREDTNVNAPRAIPMSSLMEIPYVKLHSSSLLKVKSSIQKVRPATGIRTGEWLGAGTQLMFLSKVQVNGQWYFRTEYDTLFGLDKGINERDLEGATYVSLETPRMMELTSSQEKVQPFTGERIGPLLTKGTKLFFSTKVQVNGQWYLRTEYDTSAGLDKGIPVQYLRDV